MQVPLRRTYTAMILPAVLGFIVGFANSYINIIPNGSSRLTPILAPVLFILSLVFAVAVPIFYRAVFAHKHRNANQVKKDALIRFEKNLIRFALLTPYFSMLAYLFSVPEFYMVGSFLASLYAVYYFYPSQRRIDFEMKLFRVNAT